MSGSYEFYLQYADKDVSRLVLEDIVKEYQEAKREEVFASCFVKVFSLAMRCLSKFYTLDDGDKEEIAVEKLLSALSTFKPNSGCGFKSYYCNLLNKTAQDRVAKSIHRSHGLVDGLSLEVLSELGMDFADEDDDIDVCDILDRKNLRERDLKLCRYILSENHELSVREMADHLGMTQAGVYSMLKRLRGSFTDEYREYKGTRK